jgi:hypothetical protein
VEGAPPVSPPPVTARPPGRTARWLQALAEPARRGALGVLRAARQFWRDPELAPLRWLLLIGLAVRLVLAPLTSWAGDTPSFINAGINTVVTGSPYTTFFFNPPLGAYLQAPFLALLGLVVPFPAFVQFVPGVEPVSLLTDLATTAVPIPAALLALKLPLILADVATGAAIFLLVRPGVGTRRANWIAAAWLLNPLPIWVSSVHAEYDPLVALALVGLAAALARRNAFGAGLCLGLGAMGKLYPALALPFVLVYLLAPKPVDGGARRSRTLGLFSAGLALAILPFAAVLPGAVLPLALVGGATTFGGLSLFVIFNPTALKAVSLPPGLLSSAVQLYEIQLVLGAIAIAGATIAWFFLMRRDGARPYSASEIAPALLWIGLGSILLDPAPQSENMIGPLALLLLAAPVLGRLGYGAYLTLSAAGIGLYWALLTPAAYFYPLWVVLGPASVAAANRYELAFLNARGLVSQGGLWFVTGVAGGTAVYVAWALAGWFALRRAIGDRGRPA